MSKHLDYEQHVHDQHLDCETHVNVKNLDYETHVNVQNLDYEKHVTVQNLDCKQHVNVQNLDYAKLVNVQNLHHLQYSMSRRDSVGTIRLRREPPQGAARLHHPLGAVHHLQREAGPFRIDRADQAISVVLAYGGTSVDAMTHRAHARQTPKKFIAQKWRTRSASARNHLKRDESNL